MTDYAFDTYKPAFSKGLVTSLVLCQESLDGMRGDVVPSEEALRILNAVGDAIAATFNNARATFNSSFRQWNRSELKAYTQSNPLKLKAFLDRPTSDFTVMVPIPEGMRAHYKPTAELLRSWEQKIDFGFILNRALVYLNLYMKRDPKDFSTMVKETQVAISQVKKVTKEDVEKSLRQVFVGVHEGKKEVPASSVFESMTDVVATYDLLMPLDEIYKAATTNSAKTADIEKTINYIVENATGDMTKDYLKSVQEFVYTLAVQFDMYGVILHELQRVEHNFTVALRNLVTKN